MKINFTKKLLYMYFPGQDVIKFVLKFADKVCSESNVTDDHMKAVNQMIPGAGMYIIFTIFNSYFDFTKFFSNSSGNASGRIRGSYNSGQKIATDPKIKNSLAIITSR